MNEKQIHNELKRISDSVPSNLKKNIMKEKEDYMAIKEVVERGLVDKDVKPELKRKLRLIKNSGLLAKKEEVENYKITRQIGAYLDREIKRAIRLKRLPKQPNDNYLNKIKKI